MEARDYFENIGTGRAHVIPRPSNEYMDRRLRALVEQANNSGDCIINVGNGYYRPAPGDPVDEKELNEYLAKELSRARKILKKRMSMRMAFEGWKDDYLYSCHSRKA